MNTSTALVLHSLSLYADGIMRKPIPMHLYEFQHRVYPSSVQWSVMHDVCAAKTAVPDDQLRSMGRTIEAFGAECVVCGKQLNPLERKKQLAKHERMFRDSALRRKLKAKSSNIPPVH